MRSISIALLSMLLVLSGCKKQVKCDPTDSQKVCEAFQQCVRTDTSTEVCRMGEQDANKIEKGARVPEHH